MVEFHLHTRIVAFEHLFDPKRVLGVTDLRLCENVLSALDKLRSVFAFHQEFPNVNTVAMNHGNGLENYHRREQHDMLWNQKENCLAIFASCLTTPGELLCDFDMVSGHGI